MKKGTLVTINHMLDNTLNLTPSQPPKTSPNTTSPSPGPSRLHIAPAPTAPLHKPLPPYTTLHEMSDGHFWHEGCYYTICGPGTFVKAITQDPARGQWWYKVTRDEGLIWNEGEDWYYRLRLWGCGRGSGRVLFVGVMVVGVGELVGAARLRRRRPRVGMGGVI